MKSAKDLFISVELSKLADAKGCRSVLNSNNTFGMWYGFGDGKTMTEDGHHYKTTEPELFIDGSYPDVEDRVRELKLHPFAFAYAYLYQQILDWFEEEHDICIILRPNYNAEGRIWFIEILDYRNNHITKIPIRDEEMKSLNEIGLETYKIFEDKYTALEAGIKRAFEML